MADVSDRCELVSASELLRVVRLQPVLPMASESMARIALAIFSLCRFMIFLPRLISDFGA